MRETEKPDHKLKMWPMFFEQLLQDKKPWEFRSRDRNYMVGDWVEYGEWCPLRHMFTGRSERVIILQTVDDGEWCAFRQERQSVYEAAHGAKGG